MPEEDTYKCCFSKMAHSLLHNLRNFLYIANTHGMCACAKSAGKRDRSRTIT